MTDGSEAFRGLFIFGYYFALYLVFILFNSIENMKIIDFDMVFCFAVNIISLIVTYNIYKIVVFIIDFSFSFNRRRI